MHIRTITVKKFYLTPYEANELRKAMDEADNAHSGISQVHELSLRQHIQVVFTEDVHDQYMPDIKRR